MYEENPYAPYPLDLKGTFCEIATAKHVRFFEIYSIKYDVEQVQRLKNMKCLQESIIWQYISLAGEKNIDSKTYFLYKLKTYIGDISIVDTWDFNENISDYEEYGFTSFNKLIRFCNKNWNISESDFVPIEQTHIP